MIDLMPNVTFFIQLGIFLFAMASLHFLVFRPVLKILARREELTRGSREQAEILTEQTGLLVEEYSEKMHQARDQGLSEKETLTKEGERQARDILSQARENLEGKLEENRQEVAAQAKEAQLVLRKYSRDLSQEMAEKLIGRKVSA